MRTEQEMYELILGVAKEDERVRAVYMNGSRANSNVAKDKHRDFDIVFVVRETATFLKNKNWVTIFGELAIVQEPDSKDFGWGKYADYSRSYCWLMLFKDGTRIDLHIQTAEAMLKDYTSDSLTVPLLDKDNILPHIPPSTDKDYWVKKPERSSYDGCCNEFWWCLNNVAKGIVRDQFPYAMRMFDGIIRPELMKMIEWYIGIRTNFSVTTGMWGKYFKKYLPEELYVKLMKTYSNSNYTNVWSAIFTACDLFRCIAKEVGNSLGFKYNYNDDENTIEYLKMMEAEYLQTSTKDA